MITNFRNHWDNVKSTYYDKYMLKENMDETKLYNELDTIFIKVDELTNKPVKAWKGSVKNILNKNNRISFDVSIKNEIQIPKEFTNYKKGWYMIDKELPLLSLTKNVKDLENDKSELVNDKYKVNKSDKFWSIIGKIALIIALIVGIVELYNYLFTEKIKLSVVSNQETFSNPTYVLDSLTKFNDILNENILSLYALSLKLNNTELDSIRKRFENVSTNINTEVKPYLKGNYSVWEIQISNNGNLEAKDILLETPFTGFCKVSKIGDQDISYFFNNNINLGTLRPDNSINVIIWTEYYYDSYFYGEKIKVTSPNSVFYNSNYEKVIGTSAWIAKHYMLIIFSIIVILIFTIPNIKYFKTD